MSLTYVVHNRIELALHTLRDGKGRPLLLLHGLGECSPKEVPAELAAWPGPVAALDFTGHGASTVPAGGGYSAEILIADADAALLELGSATLAGRGLGAYVALLLAGARPRQVRGAILRDGHGLAGGGPRPGTPSPPVPAPSPERSPDPLALQELSHDVRPADYALSFVRQANELSGLARPFTVCCRERPDWLRAVLDDPGAELATIEEAVAYYADRN